MNNYNNNNCILKQNNKGSYTDFLITIVVGHVIQTTVIKYGSLVTHYKQGCTSRSDDLWIIRVKYVLKYLQVSCNGKTDRQIAYIR